ncbi:unnamed protein product [Phaedon cochleariae]|uniref:ER-bound oxygenase mpaB/mpaB'/Rubber oxygenase catalytic domain-containing protein n=1 Tax=Phaedon cochleariae TaxID=80249 RepID=A0A9N9SL39_PHACE|nr:unnamed protein product [Phaedon cochleariae]
MHNFASKLSHRKLDYRINQLEMALTQFGFIGFALVRGRFIGIHEVSEEELKGFIHLWRALGYVLGIEDRSWSSLEKVRKMHNFASKLGHRKLDYRINQLEMALTQFGFIGFALVRGRFIGIHEVSEEELKGFIHLWRALGYVLGIEDRSWSSLEKVRKMHNFASNLGHRKLDYRINQLEMALTQFGFIGFALVRGRFIGIHEVSEEELKGFIHLWRAVGYVLGIEDRFNICRESVKETKEICEELMRRVFIPGLQQPGDDFYNVAKVVVEGFRGMIPGLHLDNMLHYTHMIMESNEDVANCAKDHLSPLDTIEQLKLKILVNVMWAMQYRIFRFIMNNFLLLIIWLWINFPIVAYWKFGITHHSHVRI